MRTSNRIASRGLLSGELAGAGRWRGLRRGAAVLPLLALASTAALEGVARARPPAPFVAPLGARHRSFCANPDAQGRRCYGYVLVDATDKPISDATSPPGGWTPTELEAAYGLPTKGGGGPIIATYIGAHYTNAESDMAAYRAKFGMSPCTSASGCFMQVNDTGGTDFSGVTDDGCSNGMGEESLDMDMLMAGCPDCKILLIEGNDNAHAIATAAKLGAVAMSMSWGYGPYDSSDDTTWTPPPGLALFAASGDSGLEAPPAAPAACTRVTAVGGTQLATDSSARGYRDTLPSGWFSGTGCATAIAKPAWQLDTSCSARMVTDLSANGDNVANYCTSPAGSNNWNVTGGTSASSPFATGALAELGLLGSDFGPSWVYANQARFSDVTSGGPVSNCASGSPTYYCRAVPGYDGPTGVGVPYGPLLTGAGGDAGAGGDGGSGGSSGGSSSGSGGGSSSGSSSGGGGGSSNGSSSGGASSSSGAGAGSSGGSSSGSGAGGSSSGSTTGADGGDAPSNGSNPGAGAGASAGCGCRILVEGAGDRTSAWLALPALAAAGRARSRRRRRRVRPS